MIKIILIDGQRARLEPLRQILIEENYDVQTIGDGQAALGAIARSAPHLVLINLPTAKIDGMTLLERIRAHSVVPIIMLGALRDEIDEIMGLRLGADDYIHAPVSPRLLCERIKGLLRRHAVLLAHAKTDPMAEPAFVCGNLVIDPSRYEVTLNDQPISMTATEFHILLALVRRPGVVKTREELVAASYSEDSYTDCRAIDCHIKRIRHKMRKVDQSFTYIETLYGLGYRFSAPSHRLRATPKPDANPSDFSHACHEANAVAGYPNVVRAPRAASLPDLQNGVDGAEFKKTEIRPEFAMDTNLAEMMKQ